MSPEIEFYPWKLISVNFVTTNSHLELKHSLLNSHCQTNANLLGILEEGGESHPNDIGN